MPFPRRDRRWENPFSYGLPSAHCRLLLHVLPRPCFRATTSGFPRQPFGRPALASFVSGAPRFSLQPDRGQAHGEGSNPCRAEPLGHPTGGNSKQISDTFLFHREALRPGRPHTHTGVECILCALCVSSAQLSVGRVQSLDSQKPKAVAKGDFHGCLENLVYNGLNLIELVKNKDRQVTVMVS